MMVQIKEWLIKCTDRFDRNMRVFGGLTKLTLT